MAAYGPRAASARFLDDTVATASPARLLVMLYDRLVLDLDRAEVAQIEGRRDDAAAALRHAQDIVFELMGSLDLTVWPQGRSLMSVYTWLVSELSAALVGGDPLRTAGCRACVEPLRDTWRQAALQTMGAAPASAVG